MEQKPTETPQPMPTQPPQGAGDRKPWATPRLVEHGKVATATAGSSTIPSDRALKEGFAPVDPREVLAGLLQLPIDRWSYRGETARHLGPMAQDFAAAFGLGADDRHIFPVDAAGVALAALQGLHGLVQTQATRLDGLERELTALRRDAAALRVEVALREREPVA